MAFSITTSGSNNVGSMRQVYGTFTSASGDSSMTLAYVNHGLGFISDYNVTLDTGGVSAHAPKVTISGGTLTITFEDTEGYSGKWSVTGRSAG